MVAYKNIELPEQFDVPEIEVEVEYEIGNDGIGSYEYWGSQGFDSGTDYADIQDIKPILPDHQKHLLPEIEKYINCNFDEIAESLSDKIDIY
jgi:hypothetical protein